MESGFSTKQSCTTELANVLGYMFMPWRVKKLRFCFFALFRKYCMMMSHKYFADSIKKKHRGCNYLDLKNLFKYYIQKYYSVIFVTKYTLIYCR